MKKILSVLSFCLLGFAANAQFGYSIGSVNCFTSMGFNVGAQKMEATYQLLPAASMNCSGNPSDYQYNLGTEVQVSFDYSSLPGQCTYKANNALNTITATATVPSGAPNGSYVYDYYELKSVCGSKLLFEVYRSMSGNVISILVYSHDLVISGLGCY